MLIPKHHQISKTGNNKMLHDILINRKPPLYLLACFQNCIRRTLFDWYYLLPFKNTTM